MTLITRLVVLGTLGACLYGFVGSAAAQAQLKVGTVDINRLIKEHAKTKEAETKLNEAKNAAKREFDERADAYKKALDEINRLGAQLDAPALSAEAKTAKARERDDKIAAIKTMEREINEFRASREQQLQQQVMRFRGTIVKEITDAVMERVKANNMDLVFDKSGASANGFSPVLFSRADADFTAEVIAAVQKSSETAAAVRSPASSSPAASKPAKP